MFNLTFLGTSAGMPTKSRNVSALAIECVNPYATGAKKQQTFHRPWVLIDCGEGTQHQLLQTPLSLRQLALICITHVHGDHCYGLPGLLASMAMNARQEALTLLAPKAIKQLLDTLIATTFLQLPFAINFLAIEDCLTQNSGKLTIEFARNHVLDITITALSHRVPSYAFALTQTVEKRRLNKHKLKEKGIAQGPIWGKLQAGENVVLSAEQASQYGQQTLTAEDFITVARTTHKVVVAGDNDNPDLLQQAVDGAQLLIHEATYTQEIKDRILHKVLANPEQAFDPMHTSAQQIARFAQKMNLENLILTHFSARYQLFDNPKSTVANMSAIRLEVARYFHGNVWLARDFAQFSVEKTVRILNQSR